MQAHLKTVCPGPDWAAGEEDLNAGARQEDGHQWALQGDWGAQEEGGDNPGHLNIFFIFFYSAFLFWAWNIYILLDLSSLLRLHHKHSLKGIPKFKIYFWSWNHKNSLGLMTFTIFFLPLFIFKNKAPGQFKILWGSNGTTLGFKWECIRSQLTEIQ